MRLRFKQQPHQAEAVAAVLDCFDGQPSAQTAEAANGELALTGERLLGNVRAVQERGGLTPSEDLGAFTTSGRGGARVPVPSAYKRAALAAAPLHLDIEMETGTGKTYVYIKTMFELHRRHGWAKFVVMVPSVAIREGVRKTLEMTSGHFAETYGRKARVFTYDSRRLSDLAAFAAEPGIAVLVINIQAFAARGREYRRIWDELDAFQSRRPIDMIAGCRPVLILDEPQKMEGPATTSALPAFRPLFVLRYSATHRVRHCLVHRLDALDAYSARLVKKIAVRGIEARGPAGGWLYLEGIETSARAPVARIGLEVGQASGEVVRRVRRMRLGDDLQAVSGLKQYGGLVITQIDALRGAVEFGSGEVLSVGEVIGDLAGPGLRRLQIRETIRAHLDRERRLFPLGIKVLSLFFIDQVAKYRDEARADRKGEYARIFEEEYARHVAEYPVDGRDGGWRSWLAGIGSGQTHKGYFSVDRRSGRMRDPAPGARGGPSEDTGAYDLILKDKERLLSFDEPTRFLFSHSALREGWDNPNVFTLCMLRESDSAVSRRQEVGRGLRLAVDSEGNRVDTPSEVHEVNVLTVVAGESYSAFASGLQSEIAQTLEGRGEKTGTRIPVVENGRVGRADLPAISRRTAGAAVPRVDLDTGKLIAECARALDRGLEVPGPHFVVRTGEQGRDGLLTSTGTSTEAGGQLAGPRQDLTGSLCAATGLTRATVAAILGALDPLVFQGYARNPEAFVAGASRLILRQMDDVLTERAG